MSSEGPVEEADPDRRRGRPVRRLAAPGPARSGSRRFGQVPRARIPGEPGERAEAAHAQLEAAQGPDETRGGEIAVRELRFENVEDLRDRRVFG